MNGSLPVLDRIDGARIDAALREHPGFLWLDPQLAPLARAVLAAARAFFALPLAVKQAIAIERSPHFRGWSEMRNARDWREQIHFGRERPPAGREPPYLRLEGPNLWPPDPRFRATVAAYMTAVAAIGERLLAALAAHLALDPAAFAEIGDRGYQLLKLIGYHGQHEPQALRPGVAAHVDFSYLTLTLQDDPGLTVRHRDGSWIDVPVVSGALWVHTGELLQLATRGAHPATPHRVLNRALDHQRVSLPWFVNPPLRAVVPVFTRLPVVTIPADPQHVHRVLRGDALHQPLVFGPAEWRRKGLNLWCADCVPGA
ncbi:MAG: 2-oxoglutarate and iron-dependent oxygenase domain-containing protein [Planctomycetota bacterium]